MKTAGIVHLPSFGFILTIFTGYKVNSVELVSQQIEFKSIDGQYVIVHIDKLAQANAVDREVR
jgi:hypothetical protein